MTKIVIITILALLTLQVSFGQQFFYYDETGHKFTRNPKVCAFEFEDSLLQDAPNTLLKETESSVFDWERKLAEYTGNPQSWDFNFVIIGLEEKDNPFSDWDCDVTIKFEREPSSEEKFEYQGYTDLYPLGVSDITIFYSEIAYEYKEEIIDGESWMVPTPTHYVNVIDPYVGETIRHELGHALGLDHIPAEAVEYTTDSEGIPIGKSIMIEYFESMPENAYFAIMPYDVNAVIVLYGEEGFSSSENFWYEVIADLALFAGIAAVIIYFVRRRRKRREKVI